MMFYLISSLKNTIPRLHFEPFNKDIILPYYNINSRFCEEEILQRTPSSTQVCDLHYMYINFTNPHSSMMNSEYSNVSRLVLGVGFSFNT